MNYNFLLHSNPTACCLVRNNNLNKMNTVNNKNMYFYVKNESNICINKIIRKTIGNIILEV